MLMTDEIVKMKDLMVAAIPLERLYLFGSYAYGEPREDSDYDFYAVIPNGGIRPVEAIPKMYEAILDMQRKPVDILAKTVEVFERRSKQITLERTIVEKGVLLYERQ